MPELNRSLGKLILGIAAATCSVVAAARDRQRSRRSRNPPLSPHCCGLANLWADW